MYHKKAKKKKNATENGILFAPCPEGYNQKAQLCWFSLIIKKKGKGPQRHNNRGKAMTQ